LNITNDSGSHRCRFFIPYNLFASVCVFDDENK